MNALLAECAHLTNNVQFSSFLPPATKLVQGNIFTGVCDSVNSVEMCFLGGGCFIPGGASSQAGVCSQGGPGRDPRDGYCCGRYASYWDAFLSYMFLRKIRLNNTSLFPPLGLASCLGNPRSASGIIGSVHDCVLMAIDILGCLMFVYSCLCSYPQLAAFHAIPIQPNQQPQHAPN